MNAMIRGSAHGPVFAVTVTYGQRREMLRQMLAGTLAEGVSDVIVVDNGAAWDVAELIQEFPPETIRLVSMGSNQGSAVGFAAGISAAMDAGAAMIWLLDDDNRPQAGALASLLAAYDGLLAGGGSTSDTAVLAFRPEHQADVAMGVPVKRINARPSSFLGFHVLDLPYKLWRRTPWGKPRVRHGLPATVRLDIAPYSGLLLHREVVKSIGLPRADFVLYADDSEWSYRITRSGGQIMLVTSARIEDLESSWNVKSQFGSSVSGLLNGNGDARAYYGTRNAAYFCTHCVSNDPTIQGINRCIYIAILSIAARLLKRRSRYQLLSQAISEGELARLGASEKYPLKW